MSFIAPQYLQRLMAMRGMQSPQAAQQPGLQGAPDSAGIQMARTPGIYAGGGGAPFPGPESPQGGPGTFSGTAPQFPIREPQNDASGYPGGGFMGGRGGGMNPASLEKLKMMRSRRQQSRGGNRMYPGPTPGFMGGRSMPYRFPWRANRRRPQREGPAGQTPGINPNLY